MSGVRIAAGIGAGLILGSAALLSFLGRWEGAAESTVYADKLAGGLPTVCKGLTRYITTTPIIVGQVWSDEKCAREETAAVIKVQTALLKCFKVSPSQSVFDAATSHAWNQGVGATCGSLAMKAWNAGNWALGCRRIYISDGGRPVWSYVKTKTGHKFVQGLANRRVAEYSYCMGKVPTQ